MVFDPAEQYDKIYKYCYIRLNNRENAEDITQETFLRFLEHPEYASSDKALCLLYTIAGNLCADHFRQKKTEELPEEIPVQENFEQQLTDNISLRQALSRLSQQDRELVLLRYINDVPVNVISRLFGVSRFAMSRRLKKILDTLRNELGKEGMQ